MPRESFNWLFQFLFSDSISCRIHLSSYQARPNLGVLNQLTRLTNKDREIIAGRACYNGFPERFFNLIEAGIT